MMAQRALVGNTPSVSEVFTIAVRTGRMGAMFSFSSQVGIGSRPHDLLGDPWMTRKTSFSVAEMK